MTPIQRKKNLAYVTTWISCKKAGLIINRRAVGKLVICWFETHICIDRYYYCYYYHGEKKQNKPIAAEPITSVSSFSFSFLVVFFFINHSIETGLLLLLLVVWKSYPFRCYNVWCCVAYSRRLFCLASIIRYQEPVWKWMTSTCLTCSIDVPEYCIYFIKPKQGAWIYGSWAGRYFLMSASGRNIFWVVSFRAVVIISNDFWTFFLFFLNASSITYPARMNRIRDETTRPNIFFLFFFFGNFIRNFFFFRFANVP